MRLYSEIREEPSAATSPRANLNRSPVVSFDDDPLGYFDQQLRDVGDTFWLPNQTLCVVEPKAAKAVLANPDALFEEHSDFFHTRRGPFGPRSTQVTIGRAARRLLTEHVETTNRELATTVRLGLGRTSDWPDAGNYLMNRIFSVVLVTPQRRGHVGQIVDRAIDRGVLAGAREKRSLLSRAIFRRRVFRRLTREIEQRQGERSKALRAGTRSPRDLFDVLAQTPGDDIRPSDLAELYMPFLFAIVGSVGFTLGWAIYLLGTNPRTDADSASVVREALRLWPIAWMLLRQPAKPHRIAGIEVTPQMKVLVSPYVTQRSAHYWDQSNRFLPQRWSIGNDPAAFMPFGWGPHTCAAAGLTLDVVRDVLTHLRTSYRLEVTPLSDRPFIGPSLAPPPFRLDLEPVEA